MRGWILVDSLMAVGGFASNALSGATASGAGSFVCALGLTLLALTVAARLVRGRS
jgi:hypothetical protein